MSVWIKGEEEKIERSRVEFVKIYANFLLFLFYFPPLPVPFSQSKWTCLEIYIANWMHELYNKTYKAPLE